MDKSIAEIAGELTEAQRKALCPNDAGWCPEHRGKGFAKTKTTAHRLAALGLFESASNLSPLTETGLAVRKHLNGE